MLLAVSFEDVHRVARPFCDCRVIRQIASAGGGCRLVCGHVRGKDEVEAEGLRRLHGAQRLAPRRGDDAGRAASTSLIVSVTGRPGTAAPVCAAAIARAIRAALGKGLAPSWIKTRSGGAGRAASATRPARTLSWREAPPGTGASRRRTVGEPVGRGRVEARGRRDGSPPARARRDRPRAGRPRYARAAGGRRATGTASAARRRPAGHDRGDDQDRGGERRGHRRQAAGGSPLFGQYVARGQTAGGVAAASLSATGRENLLPHRTN